MNTTPKSASRMHAACWLALLALCPGVHAEITRPNGQLVTLQGCLLTDDGQPAAGGMIIVNGSRYETASNGTYRALVPRSAVYSIRYSTDSSYSVVHTFDSLEIASLAGRLPPVTLVKKQPGRVMLAFGGDAMMGRRFYEPLPGDTQWIRVGHEISDGQSLLQHIRPYLELADYTSVNLESTLMAEKPTAEAEKAYTFYSHPATLTALAWAGIDYVCLGNNHIYDYLQAGLESTLSALHDGPVAFSGAGATEDQARAPHREDILGVRFSFLGFVGWKGKSTPSQVAEGNKKGGAAYGAMRNIVAAVTDAAASQDVVILQYHGGVEYSYVPTEVTQKRLRAAIDQGADLVIGHHPHVLQGFELHAGKLMAYSLGNFVFDQYRYETQRSALLYVWMDGEEFHRAEIVPIHIHNCHVTPATGRIRDFVLRTLVQQSAANGVDIAVSGGHGIITSREASKNSQKFQPPLPTDRKLCCNEVGRLPLRWFEYLSRNNFQNSGATLRFGKDILLLGDFEQHHLFGLADSNWQVNKDGSGVVETNSRQGRCALMLVPPTSNNPSYAVQKHFMRLVDVARGAPMSIAGYVRSTGRAQFSVGVELWPRGWSQERALKTPREERLKTIDLAKGQWQHFVADLKPLTEATEGFRVFFKVDTAGQAANATVFVDDLALIAWENNTHTINAYTDRVRSSAFNYLAFSNGSVPCRPMVLCITDLTAPAHLK